MIYLRCICNNKLDLNPCVQESFGQHDMEMRACGVLNPSFPFHLHWHRSEITQFQLLATLQLLSFLRKTNWHHSRIRSIIMTSSRNHCLHGVQKRQEQLTMTAMEYFWTLDLAVNKLPLSWHCNSNLLACTQTLIYWPGKQEMNKPNLSFVNEIFPLHKKSPCIRKKRHAIDNRERF